MPNHGGPRPKRRDSDQRGGPRPGSGPKPAAITLTLGKEAMATLRLLAAAAETTSEALAAGALKAWIDKEYEEYSEQVSCSEEEWKEGETL